MPRGRSPNRAKAFEIYKEHDGNITNREIAAVLDEDEKVIAVWKSRDKWNVVQQIGECCTTKRKKGAQPSNKNAVGHGGTGPPGNKNALTTGEFETLFFDTLDPDEHLLIQAVQPDKEKLLLQEIQLLTIRERRMLKRIDSLRRLESDNGRYDGDSELPPGLTVAKYTSGLEKGKPTELKEFEGILGQIQSIEDALTRVQARRQRAIEMLHKFGYDDAHLELEVMRLELESMKLGGQENEQEDDGFLEALNANAADIWGDADGG